jgi:glutamyl-Q tRNA(Asp) synthetase
MSQSVFRFAPSPNGFLHLGHAFSALLNFDLAQASGGRFLLRIEDIDKARCTADYEAAIYEDLAWLGLTWEQPVRRQSEHMAEYRAALARLADMDLLYPSFESRGEIARLVAEREAGGQVWPRDPDGAPLYPGRARSFSRGEREERVAAGAPYALRLDMAEAVQRVGALTWTEPSPVAQGATVEIPADPLAWGDVALARKEIATSYHLSVAVDDATQSVTEVVRGQDLAAATSVHRILQALLGLPVPRYRHHHLVLDAEGDKLSKSTNATGLRELRAQGVTPRDIRRMVGCG